MYTLPVIAVVARQLFFQADTKRFSHFSKSFQIGRSWSQFATIARVTFVQVTVALSRAEFPSSSNTSQVEDTLKELLRFVASKFNSRVSA